MLLGKVELLHCGYVVLGGLGDALQVLVQVLDVVEQPALFSVKPLQTMFYLVISTVSWEKVLKS